MINKLFNIIKKIIMSFLILYSYNSVAIPSFLIIPINLITVIIVFSFNFIGLLGLIVFKCIFFR